MSKFAVGEKALLVDCYVGPEVRRDLFSPVGHEVEIIKLGPLKWVKTAPASLPPADYLIKYDGRTYGALESWLRKLPPDSDSKSSIHTSTLKLFDGRRVRNPDAVKEGA